MIVANVELINNTVMNKYTMDDWHRDGQLNIQVGALVDDEVIEQLSNCVPPKTWRLGLFQVGEPYGSDAEDFSSLYDTFEHSKDGWLYCGRCKCGETVHRESYYERMMREYENKQNK